ncbi:uncharacterized protein LACBIDRAFT_297067 [Laccaria bicolor S238N-H82]|uniref:Predicted protein n=1 Tax=Laccaria bicolor (strain S238N-H82 / ATCC MYA-4686) TaxID=486041 RepID=B0D9V5_LACBS|nr:uncharacterized protein LACBIDRAFT_297046 [Laccaria bicolor S238N-H82]XP_001880887.1 uncharacterized protein LACBIDRAFT_297067 [Laccaria bicolor S238N-H82]EDR08413.1 predicted protein [Laccaria bicolor S238N-H82]EDR08662.1 predicted protein [Laccaria bicolor S238N-H82]|eukprot:XP_001880638.1 predicted protein [Laccaria bicolor S238N-H82]
MADRASPRFLQSRHSPSPFTFFSPSQTLKGQPLIGLAPNHHAHSHCLWTASRSLVVCSPHSLWYSSFYGPTKPRHLVQVSVGHHNYLRDAGECQRSHGAGVPSF